MWLCAPGHFDYFELLFLLFLRTSNLLNFFINNAIIVAAHTLISVEKYTNNWGKYMLPMPTQHRFASSVVTLESVTDLIDPTVGESTICQTISSKISSLFHEAGSPSSGNFLLHWNIDRAQSLILRLSHTSC